MITVTLICEFCREPFEFVKKNKSQRNILTCSKKCKGRLIGQKLKKTAIIKNCSHCKKEIEMRPSHAKRPSKHFFCNSNCYWIWTVGKKRKAGIEIKCKSCKKKIWRQPHQIKKKIHLYCSKKCWFLDQQKRKLKKKCKGCGEYFLKNEKGKGGNRRYCSDDCNRKHRKLKYINGFWTKCNCCRNKIYRYPYQSKTKTAFCNRVCYAKFQARSGAKSLIKLTYHGGKTMLEFYEDEKAVGVRSSAKDEREFIYWTSELLAKIIGEEAQVEGLDEYANEERWKKRLQKFLPQIVEICCKYRGYKSNVMEQRVLIMGQILKGRPQYSLNSK